MTENATADELRDQLSEVEFDIANLRKTAAQIRDGVGEAEDPADRGALIHEADEQDNLADQLSLRREDLLRRLAGV
jgi:phosphoenolpyruvate synthase/pyruvate phosphate dikinase